MVLTLDVRPEMSLAPSVLTSSLTAVLNKTVGARVDAGGVTKAVTTEMEEKTRSAVFMLSVCVIKMIGEDGLFLVKAQAWWGETTTTTAILNPGCVMIPLVSTEKMTYVTSPLELVT